MRFWVRVSKGRYLDISVYVPCSISTSLSLECIFSLRTLARRNLNGFDPIGNRIIDFVGIAEPRSITDGSNTDESEAADECKQTTNHSHCPHLSERTYCSKEQ